MQNLHFKNKHGSSTENLQLIVIDSVAPGNHKELDEKEARWIHQLKTMGEMGFGGMNIREDLLRGTRKNCTCGYCWKFKGRNGPRKKISELGPLVLFFDEILKRLHFIYTCLLLLILIVTLRQFYLLLCPVSWTSDQYPNLMFLVKDLQLWARLIKTKLLLQIFVIPSRPSVRLFLPNCKL